MARPKTWILLIGIDYYPDSNFRLRGAVNDALSIELSLKRYYGEATVFRLLASDIDGLNDSPHLGNEESWPTYDNVFLRLEQITQEGSAGDIVWMHYSGHGTLQPTVASKFNYQEGHETDAALVLLEPDGQKGIRYLRGIELALRLDSLSKKGLKTTVVLDSCHSGSISRDTNSNIRGLPWNADVDAEFPLKELTVHKPLISRGSDVRDARIISHWLLHPQNYTLLMACSPHERAKEIKVKATEQYHGAFSYLICKAFSFCLQTGKQDVTHQTIYRYVHANMSETIRQHPVLIGTENTTLRGDDISHQEIDTKFAVIKVSENGGIWINAGHLHGVITGDEYSIYNHATPEEQLARIVITNVEAIKSVARYICADDSDTSDLKVEVGHCAILSRLNKPQAFLKFASEVNNPWNEEFIESTWLRQVSPNKPVPADTPCFSVIQQQEECTYEILDNEGNVIPDLPPIPMSDPRAADRLLILLEHLSKYTFIQTLHNRRLDTLTNSDFRIMIAAAHSDPLKHLESDSNYIVRHGSRLRIEFHNLTSQILYLTIFNMTPLRRIKRLYPPDKECQTVLPHNSRDLLSGGGKLGTAGTFPSGVIRLQPCMKIPPRLMAPPPQQQQQKDPQQQENKGSIAVEDILKFFVSTKPIHGTKSLELPDPWTTADYNPLAARSGDNNNNNNVTSGTAIQTNLIESHTRNPDPDLDSAGRPEVEKEKEEAKGKEGEVDDDDVKWTCRDITIRTIL